VAASLPSQTHYHLFEQGKVDIIGSKNKCPHNFCRFYNILFTDKINEFNQTSNMPIPEEKLKKAFNLHNPAAPVDEDGIKAIQLLLTWDRGKTIFVFYTSNYRLFFLIFRTTVPRA